VLFFVSVFPSVFLEIQNWIPSLTHSSLINPNQLRHYGVNVQDNPYSPTYCHAHDWHGGQRSYYSVTTIYFDSRTPTDQELQTCRYITLTSQAEWNPHDILFPDPLHCVQDMHQVSKLQSQGTLLHDDNKDVDALDPHIVCQRLISGVMISEVRTDNIPSDFPFRRTFVSDERYYAVTAAELSDRWCIGLTQATNTLRITTQHGVRSATLPLSRRDKADQVFEHPCNGNSFIQTLSTGDVNLLTKIHMPKSSLPRTYLLLLTLWNQNH
jgi:hypothetical protein